MKATGIIRRIDELGRIVIPKEIRKNLRIKEGENLEIFIDDKENIVLKKYSTMNKIDAFAQDLADSMHQLLKHDVLITDTDSVIAASGKLKKRYLNKTMSGQIEEALLKRENTLEKYTKKIKIIEDEELEGTYAITTIIVNGDVAGLVIIYNNDEPVEEKDFQIAQIVSNFFGKHLEE